MNKFQVYVGNMTTSTTVPMMKNHFEKFGTVVNAIILRKHPTSQNGFVDFKEASTVHEVLAQPHVLEGRSIIVSQSHSRRKNFDKENLTPLCKGSAKNNRFTPY